MRLKLIIRGGSELVGKLSSFNLVQFTNEGMESFATRLSDQGGGLGAQANSVAASASDLGARAVSSLNQPRTTGRAWRAKNVRIILDMAGSVWTRVVARVMEWWNQ